MMKKVFIVPIALTSLLMSLPASASEAALSTAEIDKLMSGNSIAGVHYQKKTVQYFSKSGLTLWMSEGDALPAEGQWKAEDNQYCSDFGGGWGCYKVVNDKDQGIHYFLKGGFRAPFIVKKGYIFSF
ncbi:hypothetical protein [Parendozoicomonas sp. Alg238-R29]|uniref:hypothetical protein n=1 Tax=Parendozoicomonas sp. Alg238-R29 TaxID=2993446 RepID=UPI00248ED5F6|nr:hypothetical protein [Parendozoicomonas sp. Alg238-R29]